MRPHLLCILAALSAVVPSAFGASIRFPIGDPSNGSPYTTTQKFQDVSFIYKGKTYSGHLGEDWNVSYQDVFPMAAGTVVLSKDLQDDWGNVIVIAHPSLVPGRTIYSLYGHLKTRLVGEGKEISDLAEPIGVSGKKGTGPHLHFEIKDYGNNPVTAGPGYTQQLSRDVDSLIFGSVTYFRPTAFINGQLSSPPSSCSPPGSNGTLLSRLGGQAVYDIDRNITWPANANLAASNAFGVTGINADGSMTWPTAQSWIAAMNAANYLGYNNWRLPTVLQPDPACSLQNGPGSYGYNCTGSEMGHLFYYELGGLAQNSITTTHNANYNLFQNIRTTSTGYFYWSGTEYAWNTTDAWGFRFSYGDQYANRKDSEYNYAWPVRIGDVTDTDCPSSACTASVDNLLTPSAYDNIGTLTSQYGQSFVAQDTSFIGASVYIGDPTRPGIEGVSSLVGPADLVLYQYTSATQVVEVARQRVVGIGQEVSGEHRFLFDAPVPTVVGTKYFFGIAASDPYGIGMTNLSSSTYSGGREVVLLSDGTLREAADPGRDFSFRVYSTCAPATVPQCSDGIDNDADGKIDLVDPGCSSAQDNTERSFGFGEL